ncbi:CWC16 protein, partial [Hysterangium stoloniferum]
GFNKYYPPDFDGEKHGSKHALGDRARKIDQGILITRFELPFNIWCGTCNNHIGMGVRYNAEKRKIGMYYSTPMFAFRCKCHLCDGWFEIRTDPQNTRYVVESGARKQEVDWDPEENGGFAVHDTNAAEAGPVDPLVALEKTADALKRQDEIGRPRIESLQTVSDRYNTDPYALSSKVRKRFREEKKVEKAIKAKDDEVKRRYGLPEALPLVRDDPGLDMEAKEQFKQARRKLLLEDDSSSRRFSSKASLSSSLLRNTLRKVDPFTNNHERPSRANGKNLGISIRK